MEKFRSWIQDQIREGKFDRNVILTAPTGVGKTMVIPGEMYEHYGGTIVVTFPRINLAQTAYDAYRNTYSDVHILTSRHPIPFDEYGAPMKLSGLIFATEGSFLGNMSNISDIKLLIMDEVHELSTEGVIILYRLKYDLGLRFILMSATINEDKFIRYFNYDINKVSYDVIDWEMNHITLKMKGQDEVILETEKPRKYALILDDNGPEDFIDRLEYIVVNGERIYTPVILIGAIGVRDISKIHENLIKRGLDQKYKIITYTASDGKSEEEIESMRNTPSSLIIIATNVLMSGVTLPHLSIVFPPAYSFQKIRGMIKQEKISRHDLQQWQGRVGRNRPGLAVITTELANLANEAPVPALTASFDVNAYLTLLGFGVDPLQNYDRLIVNVDVNDVKKAYRILRDCKILVNHEARSIPGPKYGVLMSHMKKKFDFESAFFLTNVQTITNSDDVFYWLPIAVLINAAGMKATMFTKKVIYSKVWSSIMRMPRTYGDVSDHLYACWLASMGDLDQKIASNPSLNLTDIFNRSGYNAIRVMMFDLMGVEAFTNTIADPSIDHSEGVEIMLKAMSLNPYNTFVRKRNIYGMRLDTIRDDRIYATFGAIQLKGGILNHYETSLADV